MQIFFSLTSGPLLKAFQCSLENYPGKNNFSEMEIYYLQMLIK